MSCNLAVCLETSSMPWSEVREIDNTKIVTDSHYIDGFRLIPAMKGISSLANCMAQAILHNRINTGLELEKYFNDFCNKYGVDDKVKRQLEIKVLNSFYRKLEKGKQSSDKGCADEAENYKRKNFPPHGYGQVYVRWLQGGERATLNANYFLKKKKGLFSSYMKISNLQPALDMYCKENRLTYTFNMEENFDIHKIKSFILRNKPVIISKNSECYVLYGFIGDNFLIYNPLTSEISKNKGKDIHAFELEHKLDPDSDTAEKVNKYHYHEYCISLDAERSPIMVKPEILDITPVEKGKLNKFNYIYIDSFKLEKGFLNEFDKILKQTLVKLKEGRH